MKHTTSTLHSAALDRDLHVQVYGEAGHPVIAFPAAGGNAGDWEANGMVDAVAELIESGRMQLFAVDVADDTSWLAGDDIDPRGAAQEAYDQFVVEDLLAFVKKTNGSDERPLVTGVDLGAAHAMLALLRWPEYFEGAVAMSGVYDAKYYTAGRLNSDWYNNSAVDFMANLPADHPYVDLLRQRFIVVAAGQGFGEEASLSTQRALDTRFAQLGLGAWFDYWGGDVTHDWSWWTKMAAYFLPTALDHYAKPAPKPAAKAATAKPASKPAAKAAAAKPAAKAAPAKKAAPKPAAKKAAATKPATAKKAAPKPATKKAEPVKETAPKPAAKPAPAKKAASATKTADKVATKPAVKKAAAPAKAETAAKPVAAKPAASVKPASAPKPAVKAEVKPATSKVATKPAAKPAEKKAATKPAAAKPSAKKAEPKPSATKAAAAKPATTKPAAKASTAKPATKPAAAKPATKPAAKPAAVKKPATVKSAAKKTRKK